MPHFKMGVPGHSYSEGPINLSWGVGREESDVIEVKKEDYTARFRARVEAGLIVETKDKVTEPEESDIVEYKLMTGDEAREHKAIPAGPVTRTAYDPVSGEMTEIPIGSVDIKDDQLLRAEAAEKEQIEQLKAQADLLEAEGSEESQVAPEAGEPDSGSEETATLAESEPRSTRKR